MFAFIVLILLASLSLNGVLIWYIRKLIQSIAPLHEGALEVRSILEDYLEHVQGVYELPLFYGDPTLKDLLEHSKEATGRLKAFQNSFIFEQENEEGEDEDYDEERT
jgi:hypothetical protein